MTNLKNLFTILFYFSSIVLLLYISGWKSAVTFCVSLVLYSLLFYSVGWIWKKIRHKSSEKYSIFLPKFLSRVALLLTISLSTIALFGIYQNILNPAKLPLYTLSN